MPLSFMLELRVLPVVLFYFEFMANYGYPVVWTESDIFIFIVKLNDWFIVGSLTSSGNNYIHIQERNMFNNI